MWVIKLKLELLVTTSSKIGMNINVWFMYVGLVSIVMNL